MSLLTVIIPTREFLGAGNITLKSLLQQSFQDFEIIIQLDLDLKGACWARNQGFRYCSSKYVLFCDDDIDWDPKALEVMVTLLEQHPEVAYCYCGYRMADLEYSIIEFDPIRLMRLNYISTMSVVRTEDFPGFDEKIQRLQDWDVWLQMLSKNKLGKWCGRILFKTEKRLGVTFGSNLTYDQARDIVKEKHWGWIVSRLLLSP